MIENKKNAFGYQNDWAKDIKGVEIHINNAKSGLQGYYCLGCDKEMQGVKVQNPKHQSYFRHHVRNKEIEKRECVVASKVFRERLAEQIIHLLKEIRVPALYKYPPKGIEGEPMFLQENRVIKAYTVKSQLSFYEDEESNIKWGKNSQIEERYLLIRPDVTFFDEKRNPILFIEFVITHKLDVEKKLKLSRLGIDTVQIIIPKLPEDEIKEALKSVRKYKWVYNEIEANTKYIPVSKRNSEGISSIDEEQRKLFEESFACRAAQVNNLVRDIKKCLRSESYRRSERLFESELSRVEKNRKRHKQRLGDLEESSRRKAFSRNRNEEEKTETKYNDLERRYFAKNEQLEEAFEKFYKNEQFGNRLKEKIGIAKNTIKELKTNREFIEEEIRGKANRDIERAEKEIQKISEEENLIGERIFSRINSEIEPIRRRIDDVRIEQEGIESKIRENFRRKIESEERDLRRLKKEEGDIEGAVSKELFKEIEANSPKLPKRIRVILEATRVGSNFRIAQREEKRYKTAYELFRKGTWKRGQNS